MLVFEDEYVCVFVCMLVFVCVCMCSGRVIKKRSQGGWWILTFRDRSFVLMTAHMLGDQR